MKNWNLRGIWKYLMKLFRRISIKNFSYEIMALFFFISLSLSTNVIVYGKSHVINSYEDIKGYKIVMYDEIQKYLENVNDDTVNLIIIGTSYFTPIQIDVSKVKSNYLNIESKSGTEFLFIDVNSKICNISLNIRSVSVLFNEPKLCFHNLTLVESPIRSKIGKIEMNVDILKSDFLSLPEITVSSVFINKLFIYVDSETIENHATITLSEYAHQKFAQEIQKVNLQTEIFDQFFISTQRIQKYIEENQKIDDNPDKNEESTTEFIESESESETFPESETKDENYESTTQISEISDISINGDEETTSETEIENSDSFLTFSPSELDQDESSSTEPNSNKEDFFDSTTDNSVEVSDNEETYETNGEEITIEGTLRSETISETVFETIYESYETESSTTDYEPLDPSITPFPSITPEPEENSTINLNDTLTAIYIYDNHITVTLSGSQTKVLYPNATGHIEIFTTTSRLDLEFYASNYHIFSLLKLMINFGAECVIVFGQTWEVLGDQALENFIFIHEDLITLTTQLDEVPYVVCIPTTSVRYIPERLEKENYCLCLKSRFDECVANRYCFLYSVPIENYFSSSDSAFSTRIANSKAITINLYVTDSEDQYHRFSIKPPSRTRKVLNFFTASNEVKTSITLYDTSESTPQDVSVNCYDITNVVISFSYDLVSTLQMKNSLLEVTKSMSIKNLIIDSYSVSTPQSSSITVLNHLRLNKTLPRTFGIELILGPKATLHIDQISLFPIIVISQSQISFSDEESSFSISYQENNVSVEISEATKTNPYIRVITEASSSSTVNLNISFLLINPLIVNFEEAVPFPHGIFIDFIPFSKINPNQHEISSIELIMPNLPDFPMTTHLFPFGNITGSFDLILATPQTVQSFITAMIRDDFYCYNVSRVSMNIMDSLHRIVFYNDGVVAEILNNNATSEIALNFNRTFITDQMTLITNATHIIQMALSNESLKTIPKFILKTTSANSTIFFDDSFGEFQKTEEFSNIQIVHGQLDLNLVTDLSTVPNITVIDNVSGVLYYASNIEYKIKQSEYQFGKYRSGPSINVDFWKEDSLPQFNISQSDFLAENVYFTGNNFNFITFNKAKCFYSFIDINKVHIVPNIFQIVENDNTTYHEYAFLVKHVKFWNSSVEYILPSVISSFNGKQTNSIQNSIHNNLNNLPNNYQKFVQNNCQNGCQKTHIIQQLSNYNITEDNIASVMKFGFDVLESDIHSLIYLTNIAEIKCLDFFASDTNLSFVRINEDKIKLSSSSEETPYVESDNFVVTYDNSHGELQISLDNITIKSNFRFRITSNNSRIYLDKTWDNAINTEKITFETNPSNSLTIRTALMKMPNIRVVDHIGRNINYTKILYQPTYTANLSFYIFISLAFLITVISFIFLMIGSCITSNNDEINAEFIEDRANLLALDDIASDESDSCMDDDIFIDEKHHRSHAHVTATPSNNNNLSSIGVNSQNSILAGN
ncbi:hypothetical protein TRFO_24052 [Tritrichomonas foetus]|uniref:Uncharacterized protein n=1 Tax=Tritrichomonas foetus TaxID=1144522 RepID=A0A1J4KDJ7_9EUKA|nr:hypothetical protein TRFO_24052 [Tritrichomonas foetus]|eukprot:OHT07702.1 hypothetical protein TRFO_24052 [Tritrichomonas foetus]